MITACAASPTPCPCPCAVVKRARAVWCPVGVCTSLVTLVFTHDPLSSSGILTLWPGFTLIAHILMALSSPRMALRASHHRTAHEMPPPDPQHPCLLNNRSSIGSPSTLQYTTVQARAFNACTLLMPLSTLGYNLRADPFPSHLVSRVQDSIRVPRTATSLTPHALPFSVPSCQHPRFRPSHSAPALSLTHPHDIR